ncbi:MAG: flotillin, partial [Calditrichaeota bacterium]|nr:flotillin [Calditrichota bacterium]
VADDAGYLDSLGRRKTAEVLSDARKAEAEKAAEAEQTEAIARKEAEIAKVKADREIKAAQIQVEQQLKTEKAQADALARKAEAEQAALAEASEAASRRDAEVAKATAEERIKTAQIKADQEIKVNRAVAEQAIETENNNLRIRKAELEREAIIKEKEALVAGEKAQAKYEQEMEEERIVLQQKRLLADVIEPAKAKRTAMEEEARGAAASILENGNANVEVLNRMISTYQSADGDGDRVFMLNMLPEILKQITDTVNRVTIDKVSVIDSGGNGKGGGVANFINQLPAAVISLSEQIENATGVNILSQFKNTPQSPVVLDLKSLQGKEEDGEDAEEKKN